MRGAIIVVIGINGRIFGYCHQFWVINAAIDTNGGVIVVTGTILGFYDDN